MSTKENDVLLENLLEAWEDAKFINAPSKMEQIETILRGAGFEAEASQLAEERQKIA